MENTDVVHNSVNRRAVHNLQLSAGVTYVFACGDVSLPAAAVRLRLSCIMRCTVLLQSTRSFPSLVKKPVFFACACAYKAGSRDNSWRQ